MVTKHVEMHSQDMGATARVHSRVIDNDSCPRWSWGGGGGELQGSLRPKTLSNPKLVRLWDLTLEKGKYRPTHLSGSAPRIKTCCCGQALL